MSVKKIKSRQHRKINYGIDEGYRLEKRLLLMDAFIRRNFRTELFLAKEQKTEKMWKVIQTDMSLQEHLVDMEDNRLLWKKWHRGNQTEGFICKDIPIPHVCMCDQTVVVMKKPKPIPKKRNRRARLPPESEPETCCTRCCKNTPTPAPSPIPSREPTLVAGADNLTSTSGASGDSSPASTTSKHDYVSHLGENNSSSSLTAVDNDKVDTLETEKIVPTVDNKAPSHDGASTVSPSSTRTQTTRSQVTSAGLSQAFSEDATPDTQSLKTNLFGDDLQDRSAGSKASKKIPPGYNFTELNGLSSVDVGVNTDITYCFKPEVKTAARAPPPEPQETRTTHYTMRTMAEIYKLAQKPIKAALARRKAKLANLEGTIPESTDDNEVLTESRDNQRPTNQHPPSESNNHKQQPKNKRKKVEKSSPSNEDTAGKESPNSQHTPSESNNGKQKPKNKPTKVEKPSPSNEDTAGKETPNSQHTPSESNNGKQKPKNKPTKVEKPSPSNGKQQPKNKRKKVEKPSPSKKDPVEKGTDQQPTKVEESIPTNEDTAEKGTDQQAAAESIPSNEAPVEKGTDQQAAEESIPSNEAPVEKGTDQQAAEESIPSNEAPVEKGTDQQAADESSTSNEAPVEKGTDQQPTKVEESSPTTEAPVEKGTGQQAAPESEVETNAES